MLRSSCIRFSLNFLQEVEFTFLPNVFLFLLDLSAVFDTVNPSLLLSHLENSFGITGTVLQWFQSYLLGQSQFVEINDAESLVRDLTVGVLQGSVLQSSTNSFGKVTQQGNRKWVSIIDIGTFITFVCLGLCLSSPIPSWPPCSMLESPESMIRVKIHFLSSTLKQGRGGKSNRSRTLESSQHFFRRLYENETTSVCRYDI